MSEENRYKVVYSDDYGNKDSIDGFHVTERSAREHKEELIVRGYRNVRVLPIDPTDDKPCHLTTIQVPAPTTPYEVRHLFKVGDKVIPIDGSHASPHAYEIMNIIWDQEKGEPAYTYTTPNGMQSFVTVEWMDRRFKIRIDPWEVVEVVPLTHVVKHTKPGHIRPRRVAADLAMKFVRLRNDATFSTTDDVEIGDSYLSKNYE